MYVAPNLAIRLEVVSASLTRDELALMVEIAADLADDPGELSLCLGEQLEIAERRIVDDALHGRGLLPNN